MPRLIMRDSPVTPARQVPTSTQKHVSPNGGVRHSFTSPVSSGALIFHEAADVRQRRVSLSVKRVTYDEIRNDAAERLLQATLRGDEAAVEAELAGADEVDIKHPVTVNLRVKYSEIKMSEAAPHEVVIGHRDFKTDVTALFAAAQGGSLAIVQKLLAAGAEANQKVFRGYPITAAAQEGHCQVLSLLLSQTAICQAAVEESFLEACLYNELEAAKTLLATERLANKGDIAAQALVQASSRGCKSIVELMLQDGADVNCQHRILVQCCRPALHLNATVTPLMAAVIARHTAVVDLLLQAGAKAWKKASVGAWSWDDRAPEALKVGAGLAEPYNAAWAAVEYGRGPAAKEILAKLIQHVNIHELLDGRSLLMHAILCKNAAAVGLLLKAGANAEQQVELKGGQVFHPLHLAAKMGDADVLGALLEEGCEVDVRNDQGRTPAMVATEHGHLECIRRLVASGADVGLTDNAQQTLIDIAAKHDMSNAVRVMILQGLALGKGKQGPSQALRAAAQKGDMETLRQLLRRKSVKVDDKDKGGVTAAMICAREGHLEALRALIWAGADIGLVDNRGKRVLDYAEARGWGVKVTPIVLEAIKEGVLKATGGSFRPLHYAAAKGGVLAVEALLKSGADVNELDDDKWTPLLISARELQGDVCRVLLENGADVDRKTSDGKTALQLVQERVPGGQVEGVVLDYLARRLVLRGGSLLKHTKLGKGKPHLKAAKFERAGVFTWGDGKERSLYGVVAERGGAGLLEKHRPKDGVGAWQKSFRVESREGRTIIFQASTPEEADLWVRGVNLIAAEVVAAAALGKKIV